MITGVTLGDVVNGLDRLDDDHTIYADGPVASARAVVAGEPEDGAWPPEATGLHHFLEVDIAKQAVRVWSEWRGVVEGRPPIGREHRRASTSTTTRPIGS